MSYSIGETVIVSQDDTNRVGAILDKYMLNKHVVYDILLENRSAVCMIGCSSNTNVYINKSLTSKLCKTGVIQPTFSYQELLQKELLPITKS